MKDKLNKAIELLESISSYKLGYDDKEELIHAISLLEQIQKENYLKVNVGVDKNNIGGMSYEEI